jgi:hypothetical protein
MLKIWTRIWVIGAGLVNLKMFTCGSTQVLMVKELLLPDIMKYCFLHFP